MEVDTSPLSDDVNVVNLFPTPLYVSDRFEKIKEVVDIAEGYNKSTINPFDPTASLRSDDTFVLKNPELKDLRDFIQKTIDIYAYSILDIDTSLRFYITQSWFIYSEIGKALPPCHYPNCAFSGLMLLSEYSENIQIAKPLTLSPTPGLIQFELDYKRINHYNAGQVNMRVPPGKVLLTTPATSFCLQPHSRVDYKRTFVVFNVFFEGTLGNDLDRFNYLSLVGNH